MSFWQRPPPHPFDREVAVRKYSPDQLRDDIGRWTDGGSPEIRTDNPGGDWLRYQQEDAEDRLSRRGGRGVSGAVTASARLRVDPAAAARIPGAMGENRTEGDPQYDALLESVKAEGFDDRGGPILIGVNHHGKPFIIEGNTRAAVGRDTGVASISAEVRWYAGGEEAQDPRAFLGSIMPRATGVKKFDPDQPRDPAGTPTGGRWRSSGTPTLKPREKLAHADTPDRKYIRFGDFPKDGKSTVGRAPNALSDAYSGQVLPGMSVYPVTYNAERNMWEIDSSELTEGGMAGVDELLAGQNEFEDGDLLSGGHKHAPYIKDPVTGKYSGGEYLGWSPPVYEWRKNTNLRPIYLVTGDEADVYGTDNEPLLVRPKILSRITVADVLHADYFDPEEDLTPENHPSAFRKFDPDQPREPSGSPTGGQWTSAYHGTRATGIEEFIPSERGNFGPGVYATLQHGVAAQYGEVQNVEIRGNLFDAYPRFAPEADRAALREAIFGRLTGEEAAKVGEWWKPEKYYTGDDVWQIVSRRLGPARAQSILRDMGYDGITGIGDGQEIVVFDPKNMRIAKFDPSQPRDDHGRWTDTGLTLDGKPTKAVDVNSPEFKAWFGESMAVDANGRPKVYYHGTGADFGEFETGKLGGTFGDGLYFTGDPEIANTFTEGWLNNRNRQPNIVPVYLSVKNPYVLWSTQDYFTLQQAVERLSGDRYGRVIPPSDVRWSRLTREYLESKGHDGLFDRNQAGLGGRYNGIAVAFSPTQIKSAISNTGAFDPNDPHLQKFDPNQPRNPSGFPTGGRWRGGATVSRTAKDIAARVEAAGGDAQISHSRTQHGNSSYVTATFYNGAGEDFGDEIRVSDHPTGEARRGQYTHVSIEDGEVTGGMDAVDRLIEGGVAFMGTVRKAYDPTQPRDPAGTATGGQWTSGYPMAPRGEWYGEANYEQTGGEMVTMTPDEYLARVRPLDIDETSRDNIDSLKDHILSGRTLDPLKIFADGKEDGRHRAVAARELGIEGVPVVVFTKAHDLGGIAKFSPDQPRAPAGTEEGGQWVGGGVSYSGPAATKTKAFKAWFGDSKVVDSDGKPLVVYHGTAGDFSAFDPGMLGATTDANSAAMGFWFTDDAETASEYGDFAAGSARVSALIQRSYDLEAQSKWPEAARVMREAEAMDRHLGAPGGGLGGQSTIPVYLSLKNPMIYDALDRKWADLEGVLSERIGEAKAAGHDGAIIRHLDDNPRGGRVADHFIVFSPTQIKSAIGSGFDPNNPRIDKSKDDETMVAKAYDPNEPRIDDGSPESGRWTTSGGSGHKDTKKPKKPAHEASSGHHGESRDLAHEIGHRVGHELGHEIGHILTEEEKVEKRGRASFWD